MKGALPRATREKALVSDEVKAAREVKNHWMASKYTPMNEKYVAEHERSLLKKEEEDCKMREK